MWWYAYSVNYMLTLGFATLHNFKVAMNNARLAVDWKKSNFAPIQAKSLQRSPAVGDAYGTGIEILAGFGRVGITEKKPYGLIMSNFF